MTLSSVKPMRSMSVMKPKQWCNARLLTGGWDSLSLASDCSLGTTTSAGYTVWLSKGNECYGGGKQTNTEAVCSLHQHTACREILSYWSY